MNEKLEKLNQEIEKTEKKLRWAQQEEKRLTHQAKALTRKERTHRLCTRAAMLESYLPHPEAITDEQVSLFLKLLFHKDSTRQLKYTGSIVCSKQLYKEALKHTFDEPKQWEIREINEIMNQCISGWRYFPNPRMFSEYGRQKGWERENPATDSGNPSEKTMDGFVEITEQMELPF